MSIRLIAGDCRDVLATLPADSVHCVVTSPPYYGLRDYGTALWDGGDAACGHKQDRQNERVFYGGHRGESGDSGCTSWTSRDVSGGVYRDTCGKCGAVRIDRQIGLEPTPEAYLQTMVQVFREVRRVLRSDGTCWVNMGDSYAANGSTPSFGSSDGELRRAVTERGDRRVPSGLKPKDLLLMPARLALALQADGWWIRSDIIWHKPNPMPESVTDRCVSAHEHIFMLTKSPRYFFDNEAIREGREGNTHSRGVKRDPPIDHAGVGHTGWVGYMTRDDEITSRSCRNVWTLATAPYSEAHFATFPPALAERCIRAGTSERGCCAQCGKPWVRVTERQATTYDGRARLSPSHSGETHRRDCDAMQRGIAYTATTTGWQPGCSHDADIVPCTVLDPFAGAGTTLLVADRLQRDAIGIELSTDYTTMAMERCKQDAPLFADMADAPVPEPPEDQRMRDLFEEAAD